jgi:hypothetical protein
MLEFAAKLPPVQPGEVPPYPALPAETRTALLRGIGGTAAVVEPSATANPRATAVRDGLFGALLEGLEPAPGFAVKVLRLRNH